MKVNNGGLLYLIAAMHNQTSETIRQKECLKYNKQTTKVLIKASFAQTMQCCKVNIYLTI